MCSSGAQASQPCDRQRRVDGNEAVLANIECYRLAAVIMSECGGCEDTVGEECNGPGSLRGGSFWVRHMGVMIELEVPQTAANPLSELSLFLRVTANDLTYSERLLAR